MGRALDFATGDPLHLFQLGHQVRFVVQPAGSIDNQNVRTTSLGCLHGIEQDGRRIGPLLLLNQRHARSFRPNRQLIGRRCAKCVGGANQNVIAFRLDSLRQFSDRRCLADTVHAHDHHHVGRDAIRHAGFGCHPLSL